VPEHRDAGRDLRDHALAVAGEVDAQHPCDGFSVTLQFLRHQSVKENYRSFVLKKIVLLWFQHDFAVFKTSISLVELPLFDFKKLA
jgi:hypothetical protein